MVVFLVSNVWLICEGGASVRVWGCDTVIVCGVLVMVWDFVVETVMVCCVLVKVWDCDAVIAEGRHWETSVAWEQVYY